jgi:hypothetical protein
MYGNGIVLRRRAWLSNGTVYVGFSTVLFLTGGLKMEKRSFQIELVTEMLGTVAMDPEVYKTYIESKKPESNNSEEEYLTVEKIEEKGWTGFHKDEKGLFIYDYMVRGFLKAAGEVLSGTIKVEKEKKGIVTTEKLKAVKSKIDKYVFVFPRRIYLGQDKPDGVIERPLRAMTMQGPRVSLSRSDYVRAGIKLSFEIHLFPQKEITWDMINMFLGYGEYCGLGQFRNGSYGRFVVCGL